MLSCSTGTKVTGVSGRVMCIHDSFLHGLRDDEAVVFVVPEPIVKCHFLSKMSGGKTSVFCITLREKGDKVFVKLQNSIESTRSS